MGWFEDTFGAKTTNTDTKSASSNTNTQGNNWAQLQPFFQQYLQQYSPDKIAGAQTALNPYQYGAADNQAGVTANLAPGYSAASGVAANGITPSSIQGFMSPYVQNVVDKTQAQFDKTNAVAEAAQQAQLSKAAGVSGSQRSVGNAMKAWSLNNAQAPTIAGLYDKGYGLATDTAGKSAGLQLQGAGTLGSLTGAQTGANAGLFQAGQGIYGAQNQQALQPFSLYSQGAGTISPFTQAAGNNVNTNSTGYSTGTQTKTESPFDVGMDMFAGAGKFFLADGGRVGRADGGAVGGLTPFHAGSGDDFHSKVEKAFHVLQRMKSFSKGGTIEPYHAKPHYDGGGVVPYGDWGSPAPNGSEDNPNAMPSYYDPSWGTVVDREPPQAKGGLAAFTDWAAGRRSRNAPANGAKGAPQDNSMANSAAALSSFMSSMQPRQQLAGGGTPGEWELGSESPIPRFRGSEEGSALTPYHAGAPMEGLTREIPERAPVGEPYREGSVEPTAGRMPVGAAPAAEGGDWFSGIRDWYNKARTPTADGRMTEWDRKLHTLSSMGRGRVAKAMEAEQEDAYKAMQAARDAQRVGIEQGRLGLETARNPALIEQLKAHSIAGQRAMKEFEYTTQKDLDALKDLRKLESDIDSAVMYGSITSAEGEQRKKQARDLYDRSRGMIREAPRPPVGSMLPPVSGVLGAPPPGAPPPGSTIILKGGTP